MDLKLLQNMMKEVRENKDFLDSMSPNQFLSKTALVKHITNLDILNKNSHIVIWGSWYGSILVPALYDKVGKITCIDMDPKVISTAKHRIFTDYDVDWITDDIFATWRDWYKDVDLFINTSCEHMRPMSEWGPEGPKSKFKDNKFGIPKTFETAWWKKVKANCYFAFQSNNMFSIEDHINCVNSNEEFKTQLPDNAEVIIESEIKEERGTRFMLIGKITA